MSRLLQKYLVFILLLSCTYPCRAVTTLLSDDSLSVVPEQADRFSKLWVSYHGRICPLQTLAQDFSVKITGKPNYQGLQAEQVLLGWLLFTEKWQHVPLFDLKNPEVQALANHKEKACFVDFFQKDGSYKLEPYRSVMYSSGNKNAFIKEALRVDEKIQLIVMLKYGNLLQLFPFQTEEGRVGWFSPSDRFPAGADSMEVLFVRNFVMLYSEYVRNDKKEELSLLLSKLEEIQVKNAGTALPSPTHMKAEILYNRLHIFSILFKLCLTLGCAGILLFIIYTVREREMNRIQRVFYPLLILVFVIATAGLCLRGYIGGRLPMSNGYETMLFIAWCSLLTGILARKYSFLILNFSFLLSGFTLLVAHIGSMNPQITPLVPVLQSPLLSIHVSLIMISYGLCGFMLFNSLTSLILLALPGNQIRKRKQTELLKEMSELLMYPATFLMGAGIFVGAIWANVSWGRYWGWDPKEVWALITFLLMSFTFHGKTITWFQRPVVYHLFVIIIFISVLMTYFGVNYILGGKHSYGGA